MQAGTGPGTARSIRLVHVPTRAIRPPVAARGDTHPADTAIVNCVDQVDRSGEDWSACPREIAACSIPMIRAVISVVPTPPRIHRVSTVSTGIPATPAIVNCVVQVDSNLKHGTSAARTGVRSAPSPLIHAVCDLVARDSSAHRGAVNCVGQSAPSRRWFRRQVSSFIKTDPQRTPTLGHWRRARVLAEARWAPGSCDGDQVVVGAARMRRGSSAPPPWSRR
jgi:hypothetical protein